MTDDDVLEHAHRIATQYKHTSDLRYSFTNLHMLDFAREIEAQVHEELRKQEPVAYVSIIDDDKPRSDIIDRELPPLTPLYAAPIPPVTHCKLGCTAECKAKAHGCASECPALPWQPDASLILPTPTPSQQEALDALDNMDDYARMAGLIAIGPIETLRDFILARPDTEGSGK